MKKSNHYLIRAKTLEIITQVYILRGGQREWAQELVSVVTNSEGIVKVKAIECIEEIIRHNQSH